MVHIFAIWLLGWIPGAIAITAIDGSPPMNNLFNLFFPVDANLQFNATLKPLASAVAHESYDFLARYALFSRILSRPMNSTFVVIDDDDACEEIDDAKHKYENKTVVVLRGGCTFLDKVRNLLDLLPLAVIIANNDPSGGLVTMFSNNFNMDGRIHTPILFITHDDYLKMRDYSTKGTNLVMETATINNWFMVMVSMVVLPPLVVVMVYILMIAFQKWRRNRVNHRNQKLVSSLPVYIYNDTHLIETGYFEKYLHLTHQQVPDGAASSKPLPPQLEVTTPLLGDDLKVNGVDLISLPLNGHLLVAPMGFFLAYKCLICLERYQPLKTRVIVLDCKHFYHDSCLSNWLVNFRRSCPLCNVNIKQMTRGYGSISSDEELALLSPLPQSPPPPPSPPSPRVMEGSSSQLEAPINTDAVIPRLVATKLELFIILGQPLGRICRPMQILSQYSSSRHSILNGDDLLSMSIED